jgi:hypothetical protein
MFCRDDSPQGKSEFVYIDDLVPGAHLLRQVEKHIKFSFGALPGAAGSSDREVQLGS